MSLSQQAPQQYRLLRWMIRAPLITQLDAAEKLRLKNECTRQLFRALRKQGLIERAGTLGPGHPRWRANTVVYQVTDAGLAVFAAHEPPTIDADWLAQDYRDEAEEMGWLDLANYARRGQLEKV